MQNKNKKLTKTKMVATQWELMVFTAAATWPLSLLGKGGAAGMKWNSQDGSLSPPATTDWLRGLPFASISTNQW